MGLRVLLTKPILAAVGALVVVAGVGGVLAYNNYRATEPSSFVIATDRGNSQIMRIDIATRNTTLLLSNKALPDAPDSIIYINNTQMLIDFVNNSELGIGDTQNGTYTAVAKAPTIDAALRDMALSPDGNTVYIADTSGKILKYDVASKTITTLASNLGGVQGLAFDSNGNLWAAVGGQVIQINLANGNQGKIFTLQGGSDGMAYDGHRHTLDIAVGNSIVALDPVTGSMTPLISGVGVADGLAIDRQGNLFIAADIGVLELNVNNQLLIVGTTATSTWDDVAPLSGGGAANY